MLHLQENVKDKRNFNLIETDEKGTFKNNIIELNLRASSITNKFQVVQDLLADMCVEVPDFEDWFLELLNSYIESSYNSELILNHAEDLLHYCEDYLVTKGIDFSKFYNVAKSSKTSIIFTDKDIKAIAISSTALKIYAIFCYDDKLKLTDNVHRKVYDKLVSPCKDLETTDKIFQLVRSRVYRSSITDRYMWDLIKVMVLETPESYVMTIFNFLMNNMITSLNVDRNPVPFLVSLIDDSVRWMMTTVYKDKVLYGEAFGGSDDIYGSSLSKESFYVHCCNDVIGKAAKAGMTILEHEYNLNEDQFEDVRTRLDSVDMLFPVMKLVILPIASKVLEIPYKFLLTCPPKHALLIGIFMNHLAKGTLDTKFPIISEFLITCPEDTSFLTTRSSYKVRNLEFIINDKTPLFGFSSKRLKFDIMSSICGVLSASKKNLVSTINGETLSKITYLNLEHDVITFFTLLYSHQLDEDFNKMKNKAEAYF